MNKDAEQHGVTAVRPGLVVEPGSELLDRDLFEAERRAGNAAGIEEAAERLMVTPGLDMERRRPSC